MGSIDYWPGFGRPGVVWLLLDPELCAMGAALPVEVPPAGAPLPAPCAPLASEPPLALLSLAPPLKVVPFSAKTAVDEKNKVYARMAAPQILSVMNNRPGLSCNTCQDPRFAAAKSRLVQRRRMEEAATTATHKRADDRYQNFLCFSSRFLS